MFKLPSQILEYVVHATDSFHVVVGLDPIGTFTGVENISYEWAPFSYPELGRNYAPVTLPFEEPGKPGEITLKWGLIIRNLFYDWTNSVNTRGKYTRMVHIIHLSRKNLPLRIFQLEEAWPTQWRYSNLSGEQSEMTVEEVTIAYERLTMVNLSAVALLGEALGGSFTPDDYVAEVGQWPEEPDPLEPYTTDKGMWGKDKGFAWSKGKGTWWGKEPGFTPAEGGMRSKWPVKPEPMKKYEAVPGEWHTEALPEDYVAAPATWLQVAADEDYEAAAAEWHTEALAEDYVAVAGEWYTEALPEDYEANAGTFERKA